MKEIANEYGTALFMLAVENNAAKDYAKALDTVAAAFSDNEAYYAFLQNPAIPFGERQASLAAVFEGHLPEEVLSFLLLLCEKGRTACFFEAKRIYDALLAAKEHIAVAYVTSATALSDQEKARLIEKLKTVLASEVEAIYAIDPSLLGGVMIEVDGKVFDGTLRHRLSEVKGVMNT